MALLENLTIKRRLQVNALVVGIALVVMLIMIMYEARTMLKLNEAIQQAEEVAIHELSMRKHEKNFLFYKEESSLSGHESEYKLLQQKLGSLKQIFAGFGINLGKINEFERLVDTYHGDFQTVVELQKNIGLHPKDALYGELRGAVHQVETLLKEKETN